MPSRWLNRLCNLMEGLPDRHGPMALQEMRARGQVLLGWARAMDRPTVAQRADPSQLGPLREDDDPLVRQRVLERQDTRQALSLVPGVPHG